MFLFFLDESGGPGNPQKGGPSHFVLAGLVVHERNWIPLRHALTAVKKTVGIPPYVEVKWSDCREPLAKVKKPNERPNPLAALGVADRDNFALSVLQTIADEGPVRVISVIIDKAKAYGLQKVQGPEGIYSNGIQLAMERYQYFLKAKAHHGIIVQDPREYHQDIRLREYYGKLLRQGTYWTGFPNIVEGVFLTPSNYSVGIQYADFIAGATFVAQRPVNPDTRFFKIIEGKITSSKRDGVTRGGLKNWP